MRDLCAFWDSRGRFCKLTRVKLSFELRMVELGQEPVAINVEFTDDLLCVFLSDGREIRVPLAFYQRRKNANEAQRKNYQLCGMCTGIHWPDVVVDDLLVDGIVDGRPARF